MDPIALARAILRRLLFSILILMPGQCCLAQLLLFPSESNQIYSAGGAPSFGQVWIFDVACSLEAAETYNDNIFIRPDNPVGDFITSITPRILLGAGDYLLEENTYIQINYTPEILHFARHSELNTIDQDFFLESRYRTGASWVDLSQRYETLSGAVIAAGDRLDRSIYTTEIGLGHEFSPKLKVTGQLRQQVQIYPGFLTSWQQTLAGIASYEITPKLLLDWNASATRLEVKDGISQTRYTSSMQFKFESTPLLTLYPLAGFEVSEFSTGRQLQFDPVFSIRAQYLFREWLRANLSAYTLSGTSVSTAIFNFETSGLLLEVEQQFLGRILAKLNARYELSHVAQFAATGSKISSRDDQLLEIGAELSYRFNPFCEISLQYTLLDNNSTRLEKSFRNNQIQLNSTFSF